MKKPTLTTIKKHVIANGASYKKEKFYLNGNDAYSINGRAMTKGIMIELFMRGML